MGKPKKDPGLLVWRLHPENAVQLQPHDRKIEVPHPDDPMRITNHYEPQPTFAATVEVFLDVEKLWPLIRRAGRNANGEARLADGAVTIRTRPVKS